MVLIIGFMTSHPSTALQVFNIEDPRCARLPFKIGDNLNFNQNKKAELTKGFFLRQLGQLMLKRPATSLSPSHDGFGFNGKKINL
jgi:hypothetical protein